MNKKVLMNVLNNRKLFSPHIFTEKQMIIIQKKLGDKKLLNAENKQWYTSVKSKLDAISSVSKEKTIFINSDKIIKERIPKAMKLLEELGETNAFISGSFLFSKEFNDIDLFVISKRKKKEVKKDGVHYVFIPERALKTPLINSAARSSISNFLIDLDYETPKMGIFDYINIFQETSLAVIESKDQKTEVRDMLFHYYYLKHNEIPSSENILDETKKFLNFSKEKKLMILKSMMKEILRKYKESYVRKEIIPYNKMLEKDILDFKQNEHLKFYKETLDEVIA